MSDFTTTVLGVTYPGRPMFGSLACTLWLLEKKEGSAKAQALLDAHNSLKTAFGGEPIDLSAHFTTAPLEGLITCPARRPIDKVVEATARAAA